MKRLTILFFTLFTFLAASQSDQQKAFQVCQQYNGLLFSAENYLNENQSFYLCRLPDDSIVELYTLHKIFQKKSNLAFENFLVSKPIKKLYETEGDLSAHHYCQHLGARTITVSVNHRPSTFYFLCLFIDQSLIEVWTLFHGFKAFPFLKNLQ